MECLASGQPRPGPRLWKCRPSMTLRSSIGFKDTRPWGYIELLLSICVEQVVRIQSVAPRRMFFSFLVFFLRLKIIAEHNKF